MTEKKRLTKLGAFKIYQALFANILLSYFSFFICRVLFLVINWQYFSSHITLHTIGDMLIGALRFDTTAVIYINSLYIVLMLFPCLCKLRFGYQRFTRFVFLLFNAVAIIMNLGDSVYFQYTGKRTTSSVLAEFSHEGGNIIKIMTTELLNHWYLLLIVIFLILFLSKTYLMPSTTYRPKKKFNYLILNTALMFSIAPFCVFGIRGGFTRATRPITISNACKYVEHPIDCALILNTPFSFIRTLGKKPFVNPQFYSEEEMKKRYSPVHLPNASNSFKQKNVVVLIIESFGREYIGSLNKDLDSGNYKGYTPFFDSLVEKSLTFEYTFCNGRKSIDGMPSILSSIPKFVESFFLTSASLNRLSGIAGELDQKGYYTAFFHGAMNGSMGFEAFSKTTGFKDYYGRTEYNQDSNYDGDKDFDGHWAIWDEPFLQFFSDKMSSFKEPFMTAIFTASSHSPYKIPKEYETVYPEGKVLIHKCIRYTDHALELFFKKAEKEPWFKNTLFVLTSDHTNLTAYKEYQTSLGTFKGPIVFYAPGDTTLRGYRHAIADQIDIMPTVLGYLGYDKPYIAFGENLLETPNDETSAINYINGIYQYVYQGYVLHFDGEKSVALYSLQDVFMKENLLGTLPIQVKMEEKVKAIIQQYMVRMNGNMMTINNKGD